MSEERANYKIEATGIDLPAGTLKPFSDPDYQAPTPEDVRTLKAISGMTGKELCELVGIEDQRTWRRWSQDPEAPGARQIPYSAWRLLVLETGLANSR